MVYKPPLLFFFGIFKIYCLFPLAHPLFFFLCGFFIYKAINHNGPENNIIRQLLLRHLKNTPLLSNIAHLYKKIHAHKSILPYSLYLQCCKHFILVELQNSISAIGTRQGRRGDHNISINNFLLPS